MAKRKRGSRKRKAVYHGKTVFARCLSRNLKGKKMPTKKRRKAVMRAVMRKCAGTR